MHDVIVVGAGPAGSTAAKVLAEKGFRLLYGTSIDFCRADSRHILENGYLNEMLSGGIIHGTSQFIASKKPG